MATFNSRLARVEEKQNMRKVTWIAMGSILVIVGMITLGIPALVRMVSFIGERKGGGVADKNDLIPPAPPSIYTPWNATNSAVQTISGWSEPLSQVILTINSKTLGSVNAASDGSFVFDNVTLNEGKNTLIAVALDNSGNKSQPSGEVDVVYSKQEPKLNVDFPTDRQTFSGTPTIEIKGQVDPDSRLTINDRIVIVTDDGSYSTKWNLTSGDNTLVFVTTDPAGNQTRKELLITFNP
jgi:hypothetical protein